MTNATTESLADTPRKSVLRQNLGEFWYYFSESKTAVVGLAFLVGIILMAIFLILSHPMTLRFNIVNAWNMLPPGEMTNAVSSSALTMPAAICYRGLFMVPAFP